MVVVLGDVFDEGDDEVDDTGDAKTEKKTSQDCQFKPTFHLPRQVSLPFSCHRTLQKIAFYVIGGGLNVAYFSIANFCGGVESGLIWLTTGGFLKLYSGNTESHVGRRPGKIV